MHAYTWDPDFYIPSLKAYVDTRGNKKNKHWVTKLKLIRYQLDELVIQLQTQKDVRGFVDFLKNNS